MGFDHADMELSKRATELLGRQCYVVRCYVIPDHELQSDAFRPPVDEHEPAFMIADGIHRYVWISTLDELAAGVAELKSGINDLGEC